MEYVVYKNKKIEIKNRELNLIKSHKFKFSFSIIKTTC